MINKKIKEEIKNRQKPEVTIGNLYDLNKQIIAQQEPLDLNNIDDLKRELEDWFNWQLDGYAMLLNTEENNYTIFHLYEKTNPNPPKIAVEELFICLKNRGTIISIDKHMINNKEMNSWEIWIKKDDGNVVVYYLFSCDEFVIEC